MSGLGFSLFLRPLANRNCCEIMSGASPGLSGRHPARPLCPVPAHRHARPCPPLFVLQKYERRAFGGAGGDWEQRPLSISCKPDLPLSRSGMQGQTHPRERTSVPDLRLQQYLLLRVIALLSRPAEPRMSHIKPCSTLEMGHHAQETHGALPCPLPSRPDPWSMGRCPHK